VSVRFVSSFRLRDILRGVCDGTCQKKFDFLSKLGQIGTSPLLEHLPSQLWNVRVGWWSTNRLVGRKGLSCESLVVGGLEEIGVDGIWGDGLHQK